jgi:hypothetical protein
LKDLSDVKDLLATFRKPHLPGAYRKQTATALADNENMPMTEMILGDQAVRYDPEATVAIYARMRNGWAEDCGCVGCRNLMAQRNEVYPAAFRELLQRLGIEPNQESEAVADGPLENGLYHYGGWFFFVGEMVTAGESIAILSESPYFGCFFSKVGPCPKEFRDGPRLCIAFEAHFRWVLSESWESGLRPAAIETPRL